MLKRIQISRILCKVNSKLVLLFLCVFWTSNVIAQININYYIGTNVNADMDFKLSVFYAYNTHVFEHTGSSANDDDVCYDFMRDDYNEMSYTKTNTSILPITMKLSVKTGPYTWTEVSTVNFNVNKVKYSFDVLVESNGNYYGGNVDVFVDAPVNIKEITKYMVGNFVQECIDKLNSCYISSTSYLNENDYVLDFKLYNKYGSWVDIPRSFTAANLISAGYRPNEKLKLRAVAERMIPESDGDYETVTTEYTDGPTINGPLTGVTVTKEKVCNGRTAKINFKFQYTGEYDITVEDPGGVGETKNRTWNITSSNQTKSLSGLTSGTLYEITVECDGCPTPCGMEPEITTESTFYTNPSITGVSPEGETCAGDGDGEITISYDEGDGNVNRYVASSPYNDYANSTTNPVGGLNPGSYEVYIYDDNGCSAKYESNVTVDAHTDPVLDPREIAPTDQFCLPGGVSGNTNGALTYTTGNKDYTLHISSKPDNNSKVLSLPPGSYRAYVKDENGCESNEEGNYVIKDAKAITFGVPQVSYSLCKNKLTASASGGKGSFTYKINGDYDDGTGVFTGLTPTSQGYTYAVYAKDGNGCVVSATSQKVYTYTSPSISISSGNVKAVTCHDKDDGYIWVRDTDITLGGPNNNSSGTISYVSAVIKGYTPSYDAYSKEKKYDKRNGNKTYTVTIKDKYNCPVSDDVYFDEPTELKPETDKTQTKDVVCYGTNDGEITWNVTGGSGTYTKTILKENASSVYKANNYISGQLDKGNYKLQVEDGRGCIKESDVEDIEAPTELKALVTNTRLVDCDAQTTHIFENGHRNGTIGITGNPSTDPVSGGYGGLYTYLVKEDKLGKDYETWTSDKPFEEGDYIVKIQDKLKKCDEYEFPVIVDSNDPFTINQDTEHQKCAGTNSGKYNHITSSGGMGSHSYVLSNSDATISFEDDPIIEIGNTYFQNLPPSSSYKMTVSDGFCYSKDKIDMPTIVEYINPSFLAQDTLTPTNASCNGDDDGSIVVPSITKGTYGGIPVNLATLYLEYDDKDSDTDPKAKIKDDYTGNFESGYSYTEILDSNYYRVYAEDIYGCPTGILGVTVDDPAPLVVDTTATKDVKCFGTDDGNISFTIDGGNDSKGVYAKLFKEGVVGEITGKRTDIDERSGQFTTLPKGNYTLTYTDHKKCFADFGPFLIDGPSDSVRASIHTTFVDCHPATRKDSGDHRNGTIYLTDVREGYDPNSGNGYPDYKFAIKRNNTADFTDNNPITNSKFIDKTVGRYIIQVTDRLGCNYFFEDTIKAHAELTISGTPYHEICQGDSNGVITFTSKGGFNNNHSYFLNSNLASYENLSPNHSEIDTAYMNLPPVSDYQLTVVDDKGCADTTSMNYLEILPYQDPIIYPNDIKMDSVDCYGQANGTLLVTQMIKGQNTGGGASFGYDSIFLLAHKADIQIMRSIRNLPDTNILFEGLSYDDYDIYVKDINNCVSNVILDSVLQPDSLYIRIDSIKDVTCYGTNDGAIKYFYHGGNDTAYMPSVTWNGMDTVPNHSDKIFGDLAKGTYALNIVDYLGCTATDTGFVDGPNDSIRITYETTLVDCHINDTGEHVNGTIKIKTTAHGYDSAVNNAYPSYIYNIWLNDSADYSRSQTDTLFANLPVGKHTIQIVDKEQCQNYIFPITVSSNDSLTFNPTLCDETCAKTNTGRIEMATGGGVGQHAYLLQSKDTILFDSLPANAPLNNNLAFFDYLPPSFTYQVSVTDANNCWQQTHIDSLPIFAYTNPEIKPENIWFDSVHCYGEVNGSVQLHGNYGWHNTFKIPYDSIFVTDSNRVVWYANDVDDSLPNKGFFNDTSFRRNDFAHGKYTFVVKDDSACTSAPISIEVKQPDTLLIQLEDKQDVIAKGENSGIIEFSTSGGNMGVQTVSTFTSDSLYASLNPIKGIKNKEWSAFVAAKYTLRVNDYHKCTHQIDSIVIHEPYLPLSFIVDTLNGALCKSNVGNFTVKGIGGWGKYEFVGAERESYSSVTSFADLLAGNYMVTVIDSLGATFTDSVLIYEPKDSLLVTRSLVKNPECGNDGQINYTMSGGTAPYRLSYIEKDTFNVWSPYVYEAKHLGEGLYKASVFDSNLCRYNVETTLNGDSRLLITSIDIKSYATVDTLPGNGALEAQISGGVNNTYAWYASSDTLSAISTSTELNAVTPGLYVFEAHSDLGCGLARSAYLPHMYDHPMQVSRLRHESGFEAADGSAEFVLPIDTATHVILKHETNADVEYYLEDYPDMYNPLSDTLRIDRLAAGSYIVIVTDTTDRVAFAEFEIKRYERFEITGERIVDVIKHNEASGSIEVGCAGGAGNNIFLWECTSNPALNDSLNPKNSEYTTLLDSIPPGSYHLTITDENGHSLFASYTLENPPRLLISFSKFDARCKDSTDGYVQLTAQGGWGNYQFKVDTADNYANSPYIFDLESRPYLFYVVDKRGAVESVPVYISEPEYLRAAVDFIDSVNCYGESNGSFHFGLSGGTQPYKFRQTVNTLWNTDTIVYNLAAGTYIFEFSDSNSCTGIDTLTPEMLQPDSMYLSTIDFTQARCGTDNAAMQMQVSGGTEPYRYQWTDNSGIVVGTESEIDSLVQLGQYYFVAFDYNNCLVKHNQVVNRSTPPSVDSLFITPVLCFGDSTGTAKVAGFTPASPPAPYSFEWSNADTGQFTSRYTYGDHYVIIKDTNNCESKRWFNVAQPDSLHALLTGFNNAECYNTPSGFIQLKPKGGVGSYRFAWAIGDSTSTLNDLYAGTYAYSLSDSNSCVYTDTLIISEPNALISEVAHIEHLKCKGDRNGEIDFNINGGTRPYKYKRTEHNYWIQGASADNLDEGSYTYHFADANECISDDTLVMAVTAPDSLQFDSMDITHTTCAENNGSIAVTVQGGVKPYRYRWTDMQNTLVDTLPFVDGLEQLAQYRIRVTDSNDCILSTVEQIDYSTPPKVLEIDTKAVLCWGDTTGNAEIARMVTAYPPAPVSYTWSNNDTGEASDRFFEGNHYVVVSDTNGCSSKRYFTIASPDPLMGRLSAYAEPSCNGYDDGSMEIYAQGGVGCYAITWSDGSTTFDADSLVAGYYDYVLSDSNNCIFEEGAEMTEPELLRSKVTKIDSLLCAGDYNGQITFNVSGGTEPYYYRPLDSLKWIWDTKIYQVRAGLYTYEFSDAHNCIGEDTLTVHMTEPDSLAFDSLNVIHTTCAHDNGSIYFEMKGGTKPYSHEWTNVYRDVMGSDNYIDSLKQEAQYFLEVYDKNNCQFKYNEQINRSSGPRIQQISTTEVLCSDDPTGAAAIDSVVPATPFSPYRIIWSNGDKGLFTDRYFAGTHYATVIDSNGCRSMRYFDITQPNPLTAELIDSSNAVCYNDTSGYLNVRATGGAENYTALWSHGDTSLVAKNLAKGEYSVVISDTNGCSIELSYEITEPDSIIIDLGDDIEVCPNTVYTLDGFDFYGHEWRLDTTFFSDERFAHLEDEGTYNLVVTNDKGCMGSDDFILTIGNSALKADFLMTSQASMGDTLHVMELSNLPLDSMEWVYDQDAFIAYSEEEDPAYLLRLKNYLIGMYNIGLTAYSGGCISTQTKTVEIVEMSDTSDTFEYMGYNPLIQSLVVGPNPTDGEFKATITLREQADIQLTVYSVDYGKVIDIQEQSGFDYYEVPYNIGNQQSGMYVLVITASNERKQSKIILK